MSDELRAQYEAFPYPARDPADEKKRLVTGSPSHIVEVDHYVFGEPDPAEHLPAHAKGIMGPPSPRLFGQMRAMLARIFA